MGIDFGRFKSNKDDTWVDWLADDPVPARGKMRARAVEQASRPVVKRVLEPKTIQDVKREPVAPAAVSINISIPRVSIKPQFIKIPPLLLSYKRYFIGGALVVVLAAGVTTSILVLRSNDKKSTDSPVVLADNDQKADFAYSLPKGSAEELDAPVRYNAERRVVNYTDSIGGVAITISQQPLPDAFKQDTAARIKKMAEDFSATKTIATANPTAYIGTSVKGPQTVIFSKKDLLVFIQSAKTIDDHDWAEYITSLQ